MCSRQSWTKHYMPISSIAPSACLRWYPHAKRGLLLHTHIYVHAEIYIYMLDTYWCNKLIRRSNKRRRKTSLTIFTSHFITRVRKGCVGFYCERELEIEHNCNILTPTFMAVNVVSFSFFWCSTGALGSTLLGAGFLYCILSASSLDPNSSGLPEGPFGRVWLSLPHLSLTPSDLQLHWPELNWAI